MPSTLLDKIKLFFKVHVLSYALIQCLSVLRVPYVPQYLAGESSVALLYTSPETDMAEHFFI